jgi:hypothetical protein
MHYYDFKRPTAQGERVLCGRDLASVRWKFPPDAASLTTSSVCRTCAKRHWKQKRN